MTSFGLLCAAIFIVAVLYSAVGHAGASGYIAVLTLFAFGPSIIKPTVLAAIFGGLIGSRLGSRHLPARAIYISLAAVLTIAGLKLLSPELYHYRALQVRSSR